jgi:hypothetical protein
MMKTKIEPGFALDIGCGTHKESGWIGIDIQDLPGVDIVHDLTVISWPIDDGVVARARAWHILEHIPRVSFWNYYGFQFIAFMNEIWRVLEPGAILDVESPYGAGPGFWADPTHVNPITEELFYYFRPDCPQYQIYKPKPWSAIWTAKNEDSINVKLQKIDIE